MFCHLNPASCFATASAGATTKMPDTGLPLETIVELMQQKLGQHLEILHQIEKPNPTESLAYATAAQAWMQAAGILSMFQRKNQKIKTVGTA